MVLTLRLPCLAGLLALALVGANGESGMKQMNRRAQPDAGERHSLNPRGHHRRAKSTSTSPGYTASTSPGYTAPTSPGYTASTSPDYTASASSNNAASASGAADPGLLGTGNILPQLLGGQSGSYLTSGQQTASSPAVQSGGYAAGTNPTAPVTPSGAYAPGGQTVSSPAVQSGGYAAGTNPTFSPITAQSGAYAAGGKQTASSPAVQSSGYAAGTNPSASPAAAQSGAYATGGQQAVSPPVVQSGGYAAGTNPTASSTAGQSGAYVAGGKQTASSPAVQSGSYAVGTNATVSPAAVKSGGYSAGVNPAASLSGASALTPGANPIVPQLSTVQQATPAAGASLVVSPAAGKSAATAAVASNVSVAATAAIPSNASAAATAAVASNVSASANMTVSAVASQPCDKKNPKAGISKLLTAANSQLTPHVQKIQQQCKLVTSSSAATVGPQIASELRNITSLLNTGLQFIQGCGTDPNPLVANAGINLSHVSSTAFQVVSTLKNAFESIGGLYQKFPVIESTCSDTLTNVSVGLSNVVAACGEQINLFDTKFFALVSPQMAEYTDIPNNFAGFIGSFSS